MSLNYSRQVTQIGLPEEAAPFMAQRDRDLDAYLGQVPILLARQVDDPATAAAFTTTLTTFSNVSSVWDRAFTVPMSGTVEVRLGFLFKGNVAIGIGRTTGGDLRAATVNVPEARVATSFLVTGLEPGADERWRLRGRSRDGTSVSILWGGGASSERGPGVFEVWSYPDL
jgi:hypothetical protein